MGGRILITGEGLVVNRGAREVLRGVDFALREGEVVALVGPNGSGKTTLLESLAGLHSLAAGAVRLSLSTYSTVVRDSEGERGSVAGIGLTLQSDAVCGEETVAEHLGHAIRLAGRDDAADALASMLTDWGMSHRAGESVSQLSDGLRRRLAVLCGLAPAALSLEPTICLLDEPSEGLDEASRRLLIGWLRALTARGHGIVIATHDPELTSAADRIITVSGNGRLTSDPGEALGDAVEMVEPSAAQEASAFSEFVSWAWRIEKRNPLDTITRGTPALVALLLTYTMATDIPRTAENHDLLAALVLAPAFIAAVVAPALIKRLAEERSGDWWRAMIGPWSRATFSIMGASFILPIPLTYLAWYVLAGDIDSAVYDEVLRWLWLPPLAMIDISCAAAALHLMVADLRRASAAAGSLLLLVLVWPFLELTSALTTLMDTGMSFELAMGEPILDVLIAAGSAALIWAVAVIIPED